ncbi:MAG: PTS mannose transporter subunit IID [Denitrovibrio sp.]|nr:MAG: PTS mannose transporter subunit IID [Denitrovibrio sp.]
MKNMILALKSLFYQANLNHENMQGTGFAYMVEEAAKLKGVELDEDTKVKETEYFHTHPFLANFILGMWVKEKKIGGEPDFYKKVYSSAFGALGDSFFWHSLRPLCFIMSALIGYNDPFLGLLTYLVLYNAFHLFFRFGGFAIGYELGRDVIIFFNRINFNRWPKYTDTLSTFMLGFFLSFIVKESSDFNPLVLGVSTVYLLAGLAIARKLDIVFGLILILIITGFFLYFTGV